MVRIWIFTLGLLGVLACKQDRIEVKPQTTGDYNHAALQAAIDKFVATGRTSEAYGELATTVTALRPGMDRTVAEEAELKLVVLALVPINAMREKPMAAHVDSLALTVWPTLLGPRIEADTAVLKRDPKAADLVPKPAEDPREYLQRLCGDRLAAECKHVVPEYHGDVVEALAIRHATERVRNAVSSCLTCSADPGWHTAVLSWEGIDRDAAVSLNEIQRRADPDNWPVSGSAAEADPALPEAEVSKFGHLVVGGHDYGPNQQRIEVFKELRGSGDAIQLHVRPEITLAQLRGLLVDARKGGCNRIAIIAREPVYPWRRTAYWVADGTGMRANLRPTDVVQLLLHAVDEVSGPGTVARVD
ncbi:MAG: hypothetical protein H0T79_22650 [Deltaproteobacteria bacterium]|nr:hypothetical protein [Deltaproteobacteria bacterium]